MDFNNSGGMRSPFSPRVKQSRRPLGLPSAKKAQSGYMNSPGVQQTGDVIYKTPSMTLETYGLPLPVMVTEALTFASGEVSARMSSCGWCWVVAGRRVLAWPYQPALAAAARELTLPQTDLAHKADLVVLFYEDDAQLPSCIGVSPEGVVRYWACVGQEGAYSDASAELAGQECERLGEPSAGAGLVLATTTCTVVRLTPTVIDGRPTVNCQTLRPPSGWLGGIGRRVSLLFFGSMPAHADTKLVGVVVLSGSGGVGVGAGEGAGSCVALVASGPLLQLWRGADLHEHHLRRALCDALARAHLAPQVDLNSLEIMALDVHPSGPNSLMLLIASVNVARSPERRYAIANIDVEQAHNPRVISLQPLQPLQPMQQMQPSLQEAESEEPPRCLPLPNKALLYTSAYVALVPGGGECVERVCVGGVGVGVGGGVGVGEGDVLLGAALCPQPLLFSRRHGLLLLRTPSPALPHHHASNLSLLDSPMSSPSSADMYDSNLAMYEIDPHEVLPLATDPCGKLKVAFLFHVRRDDAAAARLLADEFGTAAAGGGEQVDSALDVAVARAACELLDEVPAGDPRWRALAPSSLRLPLGASSALQLPAQLRDKARAFALLLDFLRAHKLWWRLGSLSRETGDGVISTQQVLGAYGECLAAARVLRRLQEGGETLIDAAAERVAFSEEGEDELEEGSLLTPSDLAFRKVSKVGRLIRAVATTVPPQGDAKAAAAHANNALHLLAEVVGSVMSWRAQWVCGGGPAPPAPPLPPLDAHARPRLLQLHTRALTECARDCPDATLRARLLESAASLADKLLADAKHDPDYESLRRDLIQPYVDLGQTRRAAALAEKFRDFELLVKLCVADNDMERLHAYIDKYADQGIAETAFAWLASGDGSMRALLLRELGPRTGERLAAWLAGTPEPLRAQLLALQRLAQRSPSRAAEALVALQDLEPPDAPITRTVTMMSLAKLCLLASDDDGADSDESSPALETVETRLALCEQQYAMPLSIRPDENGPLLTALQMLQVYIDAENVSLTEYDYKKALDLTEYVDDMEEREELKLQVWAACAAQENWAMAGEAPKGSLLYRLAELVHLMGGDLRQWLPSLPSILDTPKLYRVAADPKALYALKLTFEHIWEDLFEEATSPSR